MEIFCRIGGGPRLWQFDSAVEKPGRPRNAIPAGLSRFAFGAPGTRPFELPDDTAFLVRAGSDFVLQLHYTPRGRKSTDLTKIGLVFAKTAPARRALISGVANGDFTIPPRVPDHRVNGSATFASEVTLLGAGAHMHLRGKAMQLEAIYPTGEREAVFDVPRYDFNWQEMYALSRPLTLTKGSRLHMVATFDNSPNNPNNPDPEASVRWGDQTAQEMALGVIVLQIQPDQDLDALFEKPGKNSANVTAKNE